MRGTQRPSQQGKGRTVQICKQYRQGLQAAHTSARPGTQRPSHTNTPTFRSRASLKTSLHNADDRCQSSHHHICCSLWPRISAKRTKDRIVGASLEASLPQAPRHRPEPHPITFFCSIPLLKGGIEHHKGRRRPVCPEAAGPRPCPQHSCVGQPGGLCNNSWRRMSQLAQSTGSKLKTINTTEGNPVMALKELIITGHRRCKYPAASRVAIKYQVGC